MHQGPGPGDSAWCSRGIQSRPVYLSAWHLHFPPAMTPQRLSVVLKGSRWSPGESEGPQGLQPSWKQPPAPWSNSLMPTAAPNL